MNFVDSLKAVHLSSFNVGESCEFTFQVLYSSLFKFPQQHDSVREAASSGAYPRAKLPDL
jgi:hypothetical protein